MRLPTEKLIAILGRRDATFSTGGKHRLTGRIPLALSATLARLHHQTPGEAVEVDITDLSFVGIGLMCDSRMYPGEQFILQVERNGTIVLLVQCSVKRCRKAGERFSLGAEYVRLIQSERLAS